MLIERVRQAVRRIEETDRLDPLVDPLRQAGQKVTGSSATVKNALSGTWLGHRLHPLMTDAVIGPWLSAYLLDLVGGKGSERAADRLVAIGVATSLPTAYAGLSDWADAAESSQHRVGLVHAGANYLGLAFQVASLMARRRGRRGRAKVHSTLAMAAVGAGGWLGGHLSYALGTGVDHPTGVLGPAWQRAVPDGDVPEGRPVGATVEGVDVVLVRSGDGVHAMAATCTHAGGPLADGEVEGDCITCPWHGSRFRLEDGGVERAPAVAPQPVYDTRVVDGWVEVRSGAQDVTSR